MSLSSPDIEVSKAVLAKWNASGLATSVPGGLHADRLEQVTTKPYARLQVKQGPRPNERSTGRRMIDYREVIITLWGIGKAAVGVIVAEIEATFADKPLSFPPGVGFMRCEPLQAQIDQEETQKQSEDYRAATCRYCVWTDWSY